MFKITVSAIQYNDEMFACNYKDIGVVEAAVKEEDLIGKTIQTRFCPVPILIIKAGFYAGTALIIILNANKPLSEVYLEAFTADKDHAHEVAGRLLRSYTHHEERVEGMMTPEVLRDVRGKRQASEYWIDWVGDQDYELEEDESMTRGEIARAVEEDWLRKQKTTMHEWRIVPVGGAGFSVFAENKRDLEIIGNRVQDSYEIHTT